MTGVGAINWVDGDDYIGPCRRGRQSWSLREPERRQSTGRPQSISVAGLIRRLLFDATFLFDANNHSNFRARLNAVRDVTLKTGQAEAASELALLALTLNERSLGQSNSLALIERHLLSAALALTSPPTV